MTGAPPPLLQWIDRLRGSTVTYLSPEDTEHTDTIRRKESMLSLMPDEQLAVVLRAAKQALLEGADPESQVNSVFALVSEAAARALGMRPYDTQIMAGLAMHQGRLAEMQTGEGKTLAAVFPAVLHALSGEGVHVLTSSDYLARRDAQWMGPIYRMLGLTVGVVQATSTRRERREAYRSDVTYLTAREAGFDYLRDGLCMRPEVLVQRPFHMAIVDEADAVLIDEARVPMVIAGSAEDENRPDPYVMAAFVQALEHGRDYRIDDYGRNVSLTEEGFQRAEQLSGIPLHEPQYIHTLSALNLALHARALLHRDIDYMVRNEEVVTIDPLTGRVVENRRWPHGLHCALEAKEKLPLQAEGRVMGSIAMQHFIRLYPKLAGMTATARSSWREFAECYHLHITVIPTAKPCMRQDLPDLLFSHKEAKRNAVLDEVARVHPTGRPILIGTGSLAESEDLAKALLERGIPSQVLDATNDEQEARVMAKAGALGAVTISTNMAGRGTHIKPGGPKATDRNKVLALGGLYVIGTNRHESRRIDDRLRGSAGRQGDPGSCRFMISLEDDLFQRYRVMELIPERYRPQRGDDPITHAVVNAEVDRAQRLIEAQCFEMRKTQFEYTALLELQRKAVHTWRRALLLGKVKPLPNHLLFQRRRELAEGVGQDAWQRLETKIALNQLDQHWSDYLIQMEHLRDGIHLDRFSDKSPMVAMRKKMVAAFDAMEASVQAAVVTAVEKGRLTDMGFIPGGRPPRRTGATWTYMANDNPLNMDLFIRALSGNGAVAAPIAVLYAPWILAGAVAWRWYRKLSERGQVR